MDVLFKHFWVVLLVVTVVNGIQWRRRAQEHIQRDPSLEHGYRRLFLGYLVFGCIPWLVMGLGIVVGGVEGVHDYLRPRQANPWVMLWYGTMLVLWALWLIWIFLLDGAKKLVRHPGLPGVPTSEPWHVKALAVVGTIGGIIAVLIMFGVDISLDLFSGETENGYRTVFVVYDGFWKVVGLALLFMTIGVGTLTASLVWLRRQRAQTEPVEPKKRWNPRFMLVWSILWLAGGGTAFTLNLWDSYGLVRAYGDGRAQVAEGTVRVMREQPEGGHAKGDLVEIGGVELTINYFRVTPAYKNTIAHGGVLREGVRARVWHYDGLILRVDVREGNTP